MKAIALFQFYLSYVLPRGNDWEKQGIAFQYPKFLVKVRPRNYNEELFPNEVDKTLSTMQLGLSRISLPTSSFSRTIRDQCLDRIEVVVEGEINSLEEVKKYETKDAYKEIAIQACNIFINHCRVSSQLPFVFGIEEHYRLQDGKLYVITPHSISWFEEEIGKKLPVYEGEVNATGTSGAILSPERGAASMSVIKQSIAQSIEPDLTKSLLLDAKEKVITLRIREAILSLSTACEIAANGYLIRRGKSSDSQIKKILKQRTSFAEKRFNLITNLLDKRSLKFEDPQTFDLIEKIYRTRNNIAHEGRAIYDSGDTKIEVDAQLSTQFINAVEISMKWLSTI